METSTTNSYACGTMLVHRTVWDGDQVLWEVQRPADDTLPTAEQDTSPLNEESTWCGEVMYTHGPGLDRPLDVLRMGFHYSPSANWGTLAVMPHWDWRGTPDNGTFT